jgi:hypothetical protein
MSIQKQTTTAKKTQGVAVNLIDLTANLDDPRYHLAIGKFSIILEELNPHFASCDGLHITKCRVRHYVPLLPKPQHRLSAYRTSGPRTSIPHTTTPEPSALSAPQPADIGPL